jgi:hypothetical protein
MSGLMIILLMLSKNRISVENVSILCGRSLNIQDKRKQIKCRAFRNSMWNITKLKIKYCKT